MALMISGMVMKGPTPIMSIMFSAVASRRPMPRMSCAESLVAGLASPELALLMPCAQQIHIESDGAGHACRKLPEKSVAGVDVSSFAETRAQQSTLERRFTRVIRCQQRF